MELYSRPMSSVPVSIGTSLALETLFKGTRPPFDPNRPKPPMVKLSDYSEAWINLQTLIRNIAHSVSREVYVSCTVEHVLEILLTELEIISSCFQQEGYGICKPIFFLNHSKLLAGERGGISLLRPSTTIIQKSYDLKEQHVIKKLLKQTDQIQEFDNDLKPEHRPAVLILTHNAYDLTSYRHFKKMVLLESHTGLIKERPQWNTKYAPFGQNPLNHLPFHRELLLIFGDKNQIQPQHPKIRQKVYDISIQDNWTVFTQLEKIHQSYRAHVPHPADLSLLNSFST